MIIRGLPATALTFDLVRSDTYFVERLVRADATQAAGYRSAREHLKVYPSAIVFSEALLLLPARDLRRQVWAVDFEVVRRADGAPAVVGSKVRWIEFIDLAAEHDLTMSYETPDEVIEADLAGINLVLCRRLPWLNNAYDPVARLRLYLPGALISCEERSFDCAMDAIFADRADALQYQAITNQYIWSMAD